MTLRVLVSALAATFVIGILYYLTDDPDRLVPFFAGSLRGSLFAGFLTVGGFLFSLKTFIIVKLKESVYDHKGYEKRVIEQRELNPAISFYGPLRRLSHLLFVAVLASILTAVLQLTVGLINHWIAVLVCIWAAVFSVILLIIALILIKRNLDQWFQFLEDTKNA